MGRAGIHVLEDLDIELAVMEAARGHPQVIQMLCAGKDAAQAYIVMEYPSGGELFEHVSRAGRLPEANALGVMRDVLRGVAFLHAHDFAHRDISLENVVVCAAGGIGQVKLSEFGLAAPLVVTPPALSNPRPADAPSGNCPTWRLRWVPTRVAIWGGPCVIVVTEVFDYNNCVRLSRYCAGRRSTATASTCGAAES